MDSLHIECSYTVLSLAFDGKVALRLTETKKTQTHRRDLRTYTNELQRLVAEVELINTENYTYSGIWRKDGMYIERMIKLFFHFFRKGGKGWKH